MMSILQMLGLVQADSEPVVPKSGDSTDVIRIVAFAPFGKACVSGTQFGGKLQTALRLAGLDYEFYSGDVTNIRVAPKKKFPVLRHGDNVVPDSSAIFEYLTLTYPKEMAIFKPPNAQAAAQGLALQRMLEEHTYFCMMYCLWQCDDVWNDFWPIIFGEVPALLRSTVAAMVRRGTLQALWGQGIGRHSFAYVQQRMAADFDVCATCLESSGAFLTGATPCAADCFLFSLIDHVVKGTEGMAHQPAHRKLVLDRPPLMAFYGRLMPQVFPEGTETRFKGNYTPGQTFPAKAASATSAPEGAPSAQASTEDAAE